MEGIMTSSQGAVVTVTEVINTKKDLWGYGALRCGQRLGRV